MKTRTPLFIFIALFCCLVFATIPRNALATTRTWTGAAGIPFLWSATNNWSPAGVPQSGDDLVFPNSPSVISSNNLAGAVVHSMTFNMPSVSSSSIRGLAVTVTSGITGASGGTANGLFLLECPIIVGANQQFTASGNGLSFSGGINLNGHNLTFATNPDSSQEGRLFVFSVISGTGNMGKAGTGTMFWSGAGNNIFTGTLRVTNGIVSFQKNSGELAIPSTGRLEIAGSGRVLLQSSDVIFNLSPVVIENGGQFLLNGFNEFLSGGLELRGGGVIDCGTNYTTTGLTLLNTLTVRATNAPAVIRKGIVSLNSLPLTFDIAGPASPALEISANVIGPGTGFTKTGNGVLRLSGTNNYSGTVTVQDGGIEAYHSSAFGTTAGGVELNGGSITLNGVSIGAEALTANVGGFSFAEDLSPPTFGAGLFTVGVCSWAGPMTLNTNLFIYGQTNGTLTLPNAISGAGGLLLSLGTVTFSGGSANTYAGETRTTGTLLLNKPTGVTAVPGHLVIGSGGIAAGPAGTVVQGASLAIVGSVTVNRSSLWNINGFTESWTLADLQGRPALTLRGGGDVQTGAGLLILPADGDVVVSPANTINAVSTISGNLSLEPGTHRFIVGSGVLLGFNLVEFDVSAAISQTSTAAEIVKEGSGAMRLAGNNSFTGTTTVNDGSLVLAHNSALGTGASGTIVNSNASLVLNGGGLTINNENLTLNSSHATALNCSSGSNTWTAPITLSRDTTIAVSPAGGYLQLTNTVSGAGGLTKLGAGTLQFSGASSNSYAGFTTVAEGLLEVARINLRSIPGDTIIGDNSTTNTTATVRSLRDQQFNRTANVTINSSGLLDLFAFPLLPPASPTLRSLLGAGKVNFATNTSITLSNNASFSFAGALNGPGPLSKRGSGTMTFTGDSPGYTGMASVFGGDFVMHGSAPSMSVTVLSDAGLRGDGQVQNTVIQVGGTVGADSKAPDHRGGDLDVATLTLFGGSTVSLDFFGPANIGGNDQIIASSAVNLNSATLQPRFRYPPRQGDVLPVVTKNSAGAVSGTFTNWPQGAQQTFNGIPVAITYTGGDGNDIRLTVTNLPLTYFSYMLAEGNGNQSVEPDECNLLFVSLFNPRPVAAAITNAVLRATTTNALVTIATASYPTITAGNVAANLTPFQFRTIPTMVCGSAVNFELVLSLTNGTEFAITFTPISGGDCTIPTGPCESCFVATGEFSTNTPATLPAFSFLGGASLCYPVKACPGPVTSTNASPMRFITHTFTNASTQELCVTAQLKFNCPGQTNGGVSLIAYLGEFDTNNVCANYLGDSGTQFGLQQNSSGRPPSPISFRVPGGSNFVVVATTTRQTNLTCNAYTLEVFGLPCPPPTLGISSPATAGKVGLSWSTAWPGFTAQSANSPTGSFSAVLDAVNIIGGRYALTNNSAAPRQFYRLRK